MWQATCGNKPKHSAVHVGLESSLADGLNSSQLCGVDWAVVGEVKAQPGEHSHNGTHTSRRKGLVFGTQRTLVRPLRLQLKGPKWGGSVMTMLSINLGGKPATLDKRCAMLLHMSYVTRNVCLWTLFSLGSGSQL